MEPHDTTKKVVFTLLGLICIAGVGYGGYMFYQTNQELLKTKLTLSQTTQDFTNQITDLQNIITNLTQENQNVTDILTEQQRANLDLERVKEKNEQKIDTLEKLTTIDPELLKKYSKVFFLSENYIPPKLKDINERYKIKPEKDLKVLKNISRYLEDMLDDADDDGVNLRIISAYRSFETQTKLKSNYTVTYGTGANQFSADQGYSEHQLGTTVDFGTPEVQGALLAFENTLAFSWLQKNAYKYGFILSYPKGNAYYQYEPWHWRFVGEDLAQDLHDDNKNFYELDQRQIDKYLIKIFD